MPRIVKPLTDAQVKNAKIGMHSDGGGLMLLVDERGAKTWVWRYTSGTRRRDLTLGRWPDVSLSAAREEVRRGRAILADDGDPHAARRAASSPPSSSAPTFGQCANAWLADRIRAKSWRSPVHLAQVRRSLEELSQPIRSLVVDQITKASVLACVKPVWMAGQHESADRLRNRIEQVLSYAQALDHIPADRANPASWDALKHVLPPKPKAQDKHHAVLPADAVPEFLGRLRASGGRAAAALEFLVLTGVRVGEALGARRAEFDLQARLWTIPGERMKSGRAHVVPMSDRAVEIVREEIDQHHGDLVFPGRLRGRPLTSQGMLILLGKMAPGVTTHGFRSSLRTWISARGHDRMAGEMILAHDLRGLVEGSYDRHAFIDERRTILNAWSAHCAGEQPAGNMKLRA
jgi:integrase